MKFSIIHASYGRPNIAAETMDKWFQTKSNLNDIEYIISIDITDPECGVYRMFFENSYILNVTNTSVAAINNAAKKATGDIIIVISDDFEPTHAWDYQILKAVEGKTDWILKTQDGTQPWIITLPIMDQTYYERFGYVYNPEYSHMFCDTELTHVADLLGKKINSNLLFKHNHYSVSGAAKDQTSIKADKTWDSGKKVYLERFKKNFGLENVNVWNLPKEAHPHINWLKHELKTK